MTIFFCITLIILFICQMMIFKSEKNQNLIKWINLNVLLLMAYNLFFSVFLSFISIKVTLLNLSILNVLVIILLSFKIKKDGKIQKYNITKMDILAVLVIFAIVLGIGIKQFGLKMDGIKYNVTDSATHYLASELFYDNSEILYKENLDRIYFVGIEFLAPGAYVNTGILFKIFDSIIESSYFYIIYNIFNLFNLYLAGILMYGLLIKNKSKNKILALIFAIIYMLGYPLNSMLSGFSYLSLGLNFIIGILVIYKEDLNKYYKITLLFLLDFGLIFTYYYFAPMVYLAIFIQILLETRENKKKIFNKNNILKVLFELILPGIVAVVYFMVLQYFKNGNRPVSAYSDLIATPGPIYKNIITNILPFIILSIYYIFKCFKNKKSSLDSTMELTIIFFLIILFIGSYFKVVSEYYNYKIYNLLWICVISIGYNSLITIEQKSNLVKRIISFIISIYLIGVICSGIFDQKLLIFDIFRVNFQDIKENWSLVSKGEIELLSYYNKNINKGVMNDNTMFLAHDGAGKQFWILAITKNMFNYIDVVYSEKLNSLQQFEESDKKYIVIFKEDYDSDFDKIDSEIQKYNLNILSRNDEGIILEKN